MKCIQSVDAEELLEKTARELPLTSFLFLPTIGDEFLPEDPLAEGQKVRTGNELLLSTTPNEGSLFVKGILLRNPHLRELISEDYKTPVKILMRLLLDVPSYKTESLADVYLQGMDKGEMNETKWKMNLGRMFTDALFECAVDSFALRASKNGHDVYRIPIRAQANILNLGRLVGHYARRRHYIHRRHFCRPHAQHQDVRPLPW
ncbi:hypothetical protein MTO96_021495 [Rhipicephalus appendiculatus]